MDCHCDMIEEHEIRPGFCRFCGGKLSAAWVSSDATFAEFFDQLADLPGVTPALIEQCRQRELDGRDEFGFAYLKRDNASEAREEGADLALYCYLSVLRARRDGQPEKIEAALEAARYAALAYEASRRV
jgi:hypothetical protein